MSCFFVRLYRVLNIFLYDAVSPCVTQLPFYMVFITMFYTCLVTEAVYHRGGTASYTKKFKLYIVLQRNDLVDITISIIEICYAKTAPIPKTLMVYSLHE